MKHFLRIAALLLFCGLSFSADAAARFWVGGTGTWDTSTTTHWAATTGGAGGVSVPGAADSVTFDGASGGGVVTAAATLTGISVLTCGAFTGTLDFSANNPNFTVGTVSITGSATRMINLGNGTWTISGAGVQWDATTTAGLTFNANSSTLSFTSPTASRTLQFGGLSYSTVSLSSSSNGSVTVFGSAATVVNFNMTAPLTLDITSGQTLTISNAFTWSGSDFQHSFLIRSSSASSPGMIAAGAVGSTINWAALSLITFTTNAVNATNSIDLGGNNMAGGSITGPAGGGGGHIIGG